MAKLVIVEKKPPESDAMQLLGGHIADCTACPLSQHRMFPVVGSGDITAPYMIIGEASGQTENEDPFGRPFIGRAGSELTKMLNDAGFSRHEFFITNMVKCWPGPGNPDPLPEEIEACSPWLTKQLAIVRPRGIITLGRFSTSRWFDWSTMGAIQGHIRRVGFADDGTVVGRGVVPAWSAHIVPLYHPAYILRNRAERVNTVQHLKDFRKVLNTGVPA